MNVNFDYGTIAPALYDAERKYIYDIVGETLWQQLAGYYNDTSHEVNPTYDHLIQLMQSATLRIAYFESFDLLAVNLTDSGIQNPNGEATAYRYQADAAKDTLGRQASNICSISMMPLSSQDFAPGATMTPRTPTAKTAYSALPKSSLPPPSNYPTSGSS